MDTTCHWNGIDREMILAGVYPAIPALQGGVKGYNIIETPCRKALRPLGRRALIGKNRCISDNMSHHPETDSAKACTYNPISH